MAISLRRFRQHATDLMLLTTPGSPPRRHPIERQLTPRFQGLVNPFHFLAGVAIAIFSGLAPATSVAQAVPANSISQDPMPLGESIPWEWCKTAGVVPISPFPYPSDYAGLSRSQRMDVDAKAQKYSADEGSRYTADCLDALRRARLAEKRRQEDESARAVADVARKREQADAEARAQGFASALDRNTKKVEELRATASTRCPGVAGSVNLSGDLATEGATETVYEIDRDCRKEEHDRAEERKVLERMDRQRAQQRAADERAFATHTETPQQQQRRLDLEDRAKQYALETRGTLFECTHTMIEVSRRANKGVDDQRSIAYQQCGALYVQGMLMAYHLANPGQEVPKAVLKATTEEAKKTIDGIISAEAAR